MTVGQVYDLPTVVATTLVRRGMAEQVREAAALAVPEAKPLVVPETKARRGLR